jgi:hypothetical protein
MLGTKQRRESNQPSYWKSWRSSIISRFYHSVFYSKKKARMLQRNVNKFNKLYFRRWHRIVQPIYEILAISFYTLYMRYIWQMLKNVTCISLPCTIKRDILLTMQSIINAHDSITFFATLREKERQPFIFLRIRVLSSIDLQPR